MSQKNRVDGKRNGDFLREYPVQPDGMYFKKPLEQFRDLNHVFVWTNSFFTGMAYWAYCITKDQKFLRWQNSFYGQYRAKVFNIPWTPCMILVFCIPLMQWLCTSV